MAFEVFKRGGEMIRRTFVVVLFAAVVLSSCAVAVADHIQGPTEPITGISITLHEFGNEANQLTACDGTEVWPFDRMEVKVDVSSDDEPSEHWLMRIYIYEPGEDPNVSGGREPQWIARVKHQNRGPHQSETATTFSQFSLLEQPGKWLVQVGVDGDESGLTYVDTCRFVIEG